MEGIWENDDAAEVAAGITEYIEGKYFTAGGEIKKSVTDDALVAVADLLQTFDNKFVLGKPKLNVIEAIHDALMERVHNKHYYARWPNRQKRRAIIWGLIKKLRDILS